MRNDDTGDHNTCPPGAEQSLRRLAVHAVHDVPHYLHGVHHQLPARQSRTPADREARWQLSVFGTDADGEAGARVVLG